MRATEWIVIGFFVYTGACAAALPIALPARRRALVLAASAAGIVLVWSVAALAQRGSVTWPWLAHVRDWAPPVYVLMAYWLPAQLVLDIDERAEQKLRDLDRRWSAGLMHRMARAPRWTSELLELAYVCCYPMLPGAYLAALLLAPQVDTDRFWCAVVVSAVLSYGVLPWIRTRPPRELEDEVPGPPSLVRQMNEAILERGSVGLNTFPSGHVATSIAAALALAAEAPAAGALALGLALLISLACVVRRYHYMPDVLTGALAAVAGFAVSRVL